TVVVNDLGGSVTGEGTGRDADLTVDIITERGGSAHANYADVSDPAQAEAMIAQATDDLGRLDIVVNNAGIVRDGSIFNMSVEDFDAVIKVHLRGTWLPCKYAGLHWRQLNKSTGSPVGGRIINTVSGAGLTGNFGQSNYAPAKAAIASLTQTLSLEMYKMGVTVNAVGPAAATRITGTMPGAPEVIEADDVPEDEWNRMDPAVSSPLVAWLASDEADHVTGQVIRAVAENIIWMKGWEDGPTLNNGGKRWDASKLGQQMATDVFGTRAPGLRY
ncbi:MAG: SDR family oxidoreductase, partial [Microthrixaceae bacterium]|nr:SDR family oxidoreductase [Microthrixaceae bacterium]